MKTIFTTISILFLVLTNLHSQTNKPNTGQNKDLTDTMFFDLSQAVYSTVGSVNYIEFPVWIKSSSTQISSFDFWHQFDLNKLTYVSTTSLIVGLDAFSNFNINNSYLSNTTSGSSVTFIVPTNTNLIKVKYSINGNCTTILPTDFFNITALIDGNVSTSKFIEGQSAGIEITSPNPHCTDATIGFNFGTSIYGKEIESYAWDFGNNQSSTFASDSTTYLTDSTYQVALTLTTVDGCTYNLLDTIIINPSPITSFTYLWSPNLTSVEFTNTSTINNGTISSNYWDFGDGSNSTGFEETHPYNSVGIFTVSLTETSDLGCSSTYTVNISNTDDLLENNMPNIILFPNPADESLQLSIDIADRIEIIDAFGRVVYNVSQLNALNGININTKQLSAGKYLVKIEKDNLLGTFPLMIYHD
jgi:hypothetical protein